MRKASLVLAMLAGPMLAVAPAAANPSGDWMTPEGKSRVRVTPCGQGVCATIVWLKEPNGANGAPKRDIHNQDASRRGRAIVGLALMSGMTPDGPDKWKGRIYNPEDGKTYRATMELSGDRLDVSGCVAVFCKSQVWRRAN